jgi:hypothetical protein
MRGVVSSSETLEGAEDGGSAPTKQTKIAHAAAEQPNKMDGTLMLSRSKELETNGAMIEAIFPNEENKPIAVVRETESYVFNKISEHKQKNKKTFYQWSPQIDSCKRCKDCSSTD